MVKVMPLTFPMGKVHNVSLELDMCFSNDYKQIIKSKIMNGKGFALDLPYREWGRTSQAACE